MKQFYILDNYTHELLGRVRAYDITAALFVGRKQFRRRDLCASTHPPGPPSVVRQGWSQ